MTACPLDPKSFKVGVRVRGSGSLLFNQQRFATREEADGYARDLWTRWPEVTATEIHHSFDDPNTQYPVPSDRYVYDRHARFLKGETSC